MKMEEEGRKMSLQLQALEPEFESSSSKVAHNYL